MRKLIKKWIVSEVNDHIHGGEVPISIDPKTGEFWADYRDELYEAGTRIELVELLQAAMNESAVELDWHQKIAVSTMRDMWGTQRHSYVGIAALERYEIAEFTKSIGGRGVRCREFGSTEKDYRPHNRHLSSRVLEFDYDDDLWVRLTTMRAMFETMHDQLEELLTRKRKPSNGYLVEYTETSADVKARIMQGTIALPKSITADQISEVKMVPTIVSKEEAQPKSLKRKPPKRKR